MQMNVEDWQLMVVLVLTRNLYDSAGSPVASGAFLNRDETGVRWVTFEPSFSEGIFIQDKCYHSLVCKIIFNC